MTLRVASTGSGPDIALLHGWGLGAEVWDAVLAPLARQFRVHVLSLPGYDGTPADDRDLDATAAAIADALPAGCTLCGWSLGGLLALSAARQRPQQIGRLLLVSSTPRFVQAADWPQAQPAALLDGFRAAVAGDAKATLTRFVMLFNQGDAQARAVARRLTPLLAASLPDPATLLRGLDWLGSADLRPQLATITQPTLLIHGDRDPLMPLAAARALADALPDGRLTTFAGVAHAPFITDPEAFVAAVTVFIASCHASA